MKPHPPHTADHLRDLTPQEAQQLTAFLEKRRWFEHKLDVSSYYPLHSAYIRPVPRAHPSCLSLYSPSAETNTEKCQPWRLAIYA